MAIHSKEEINNIFTNLCTIHGDNEAGVVEHILAIISRREFRNLQEVLSREACLLEKDRKRNTAKP
ncbi:MAG: hypothetical protein WCG75_08590 [Armatimonadota bacterium]